jgi:hypothetical protein
MTDGLLWEELKQHIEPAAVDRYARSIGIARITRNEDVFAELNTLRQMQLTLDDTLTAEIEKKNPRVLASTQRTSAIHRAIAYPDSIREQGHVLSPTCRDDAQVMKYLKLTKTPRARQRRSPSIANLRLAGIRAFRRGFG